MMLKWHIVAAIVLAFVSGAFFGFLHVAKIVARVENARDPPSAFRGLEWMEKHPLKALLIDVWMLLACLGLFYSPVVIVLVVVLPR